MTMLVGLVLLAAGLPAQPGEPNRAPSTQPNAGPWWSTEGLVAAATLLSVEEQAWNTTQGRTKKPTRDELAAYDRIHGAAALEHLRAMGVNMMIFPYGGYDPDDREAAARDRAAEFAKKCHAAGMKVGIIVPVGTIDPRRWSDVDPAVAGTLTLSRTGRPFPIDTLGRMMTSRISPWEKERTDRLVREAVRRTDPDVVFLPDFTMAANSEPASIKAFRAFAGRRAKQEPKPPPPATQPASRPAGDKKPEEPPTQGRLWIDFRVGALRDCLAAARESAQDEKSDVLIGLAGQGLMRQINTVDGPAIDPGSLWPLSDLLWSDARVRTGLNGQITHHAAEFKAAPLVLPAPRSHVEAAEALAFNRGVMGCIVYSVGDRLAGDPTGRTPPREFLADYARFSRSHRILWDGQRPVGDVRLYRSRTAGLHRQPAAEIVGLQTEGALVSHHVPFEIAYLGHDDDREFDGDAERDEPPVMMLGAQAWLSQADLAFIESRLEGGTNLIMIGPCGTHDEYGRPLAEGLSERLRARAATTEPIAGERRGVRLVLKGPQESRVVIMSRPGPMPNVWPKVARPRRPTFPTPPHRDRFYESVRWAAGRPLRLSAEFPQSVAAELTSTPGGERMVLHRVNYDRRNAAPATPVTLRLPPGRRVASIHRYALDQAEPADVSYRVDDRAVTFDAATLPVYDAHLIRTVAAEDKPLSVPAPDH